MIPQSVSSCKKRNYASACAFILIVAITIFSCKIVPSESVTSITRVDCIACDRIELFIQCNNKVGESIWPDLAKVKHFPPILYFTDSTTYIAFLQDASLLKMKYDLVDCDTFQLKRLTQRFDDQLFHMQNKMSFGDSSSLFYYKPMMLCSDVENLLKVVTDFTQTEDWLQLVMHEYFHSFQFSHSNTIEYLAENIKMSADTLDKIYLEKVWIKQLLATENELLLNAINTPNRDSLNYFIDKFIETREGRRTKYEKENNFDLTRFENFWETIEGTARYAEYYLAGNFGEVNYNKTDNCDSLFNEFQDYKSVQNFEDIPKFKERTKIMQAYYYVHGFNLCRLMDKLKIDYKSKLFDHPEIGLYQILINNVNQR
jgi:hypothetical protein